jgi:hypothetical protein
VRVIQWPGFGLNRVEIYRVLDLSGLTSTPRKSNLFIKAGYVFIDGNRVSSIKETMEVGKPVLLSVRLPSGIIKEDTIMVTCRQYYEGTPQRKIFI